MTERLKEEIKIQKWIVVLLIPLMVTLMGFALNVSMMGTTVKNKVENHSVRIDQNCIDIKELQKEKADKETINRIFQTLDRLENKIDKLNK